MPARWGSAIAAEDRSAPFFQDLNARGQTVVMITHDPGIARIASCVVQIHDGEIVEDQRAAA